MVFIVPYMERPAAINGRGFDLVDGSVQVEAQGTGGSRDDYLSHTFNAD